MPARGKGEVPKAPAKKAAAKATTRAKPAAAAATVVDPVLDAPPAGAVTPPADASPTAASDAAAEASAAGEPDPEPTVQSEPEPEPELDEPDIVSGAEVPVYNPLPVPQSVQHSGIFHTVRAHGLDAMPRAAAAHAVGPENEGGVLSHTGLRRVYGLEPRFQGQADEAGVSLAEWVGRRNEEIVAVADSIGAGYAEKHGLGAHAEEDDEA